MELHPQETFTLFKGLGDHTDSATYYVQAVIRNASTKALILTQNLTDNGDRTFSYDWRVPADPSGLGFWIKIAYSVYTDSGYTTKSPLIPDDFEEHFVFRPIQHFGGGADIDYTRVRKIIVEELQKIPVPEPDVPVDLQPIIAELKRSISGINIPATKEVDLTRIQRGVDKIEGLIRALEFPTTDLKPIESQIGTVKFTVDSLTAAEAEKIKAVQDLLDKIKKFFGVDIEELKTNVEELRKKVETMPYVVLEPKKME